MPSNNTTSTPAASPQTINPQEDFRQLALAQWVAHQINDNDAPIELHSLGSDAGFRRYFRFSQGPGLLAVDAPPASEDSNQFIAIAQLIAQQEVRSPRVIAADTTLGFLLIEDFGDQLLARALNKNNADRLYQLTMDNLLKLHKSVDDPALIPRYDRALLRRELEIFSDWFVSQLLGYSLAATERELLDKTFTQLEDIALAQPQTFVHRDYHSRNLILCNNGDLGVIDFQGALWGGLTYDLVSLLRDCYLRWPAQQVTQWALRYRQQAISAGLIDETTSEQEFLRWFDWLGLQRHIKVLGIFARLNLRDGKSHYLQDLPLAIRYTLEVAETYPELTPFADWFKATLLPIAATQAWYSNYQCAGEAV
jgi:aminoglycoside/choline kinase family phosphotransferase